MSVDAILIEIGEALGDPVQVMRANGFAQKTLGLRFRCEDEGEQPAAVGEGGGPLTLSREDRDLVRRVGMDPDRLASLPESADFSEWKASRRRPAGGGA